MKIVIAILLTTIIIVGYIGAACYLYYTRQITHRKTKLWKGGEHK